MRLRWCAAVAAIVAAVSVGGPAMAGSAFVDGNKLFAMCKPEAVATDRGFYWGYIAGLADDATSGGAVCMQGAVMSQAIDVAKQYLASHPERRNFSAARLVTDALHEAWPCPVGKP